MKPREIVFRLNGGGDVTPLGGVDRPLAAAVVDVPPPVVGVVPVVMLAVPAGDTSGEKMPPSAYSDRFSPYCFTRCRLTSMISMSTTISARGLSFCWISFSKIWTIGAVARIVTELPVLFATICGWTATPGGRSTVLSSCAISVGSLLER